MKVAKPTDCDRVWAALREAGSRGVHSFDLREVVHTGNPSQRIKDLEEMYECDIPRRRERRNRRMGMRYFYPRKTFTRSTEPEPQPEKPSGAGVAAIEINLRTIRGYEPGAGDPAVLIFMPGKRYAVVNGDGTRQRVSSRVMDGILAELDPANRQGAAA